MVLIFSDRQTERLTFTFELIFKDILGVDPIFTTSKNEFIDSELPKINYSEEDFGKGLYLKPYPLLFEKKIQTQNLSKIEYEGINYSFESSDDSFFPFDPFAFSFYLVSRYEEYLYLEQGKHGRYPSHYSILYQNKTLDKPVVNIVANRIKEKLLVAYPEFNFPQQKFRFLTTIDIDNAWAFKNKGILRISGALLKTIIKGKFQELIFRLSVLTGRKNDPFDTYNYISDLYGSIPDHLQFFVLIGKRRRYDKSIPYRNNNFRKLIKSLSDKYEIGAHPSYASNKKEKFLHMEKKRLEQVVGKQILKSRQHFLVLKFPRTYRKIFKAGIREDYSMGYSSRLGFRAGICSSFYFFDLKRNQKTELRVHPFQVMDVTMKNYRRYNVKKAISEINSIIEEIRNVNGTFVSLWHNESLSDYGHWSGWREVFEYVLEMGLKYENEK